MATGLTQPHATKGIYASYGNSRVGEAFNRYPRYKTTKWPAIQYYEKALSIVPQARGIQSIGSAAVYEKFDVVNDSPAKTTNVLVDKPPLCAKKLPTDIQTLRQKIIDHQKTKQGQQS